ncbi:hypothetical protein S101468_03340 (plasmid) [Acetobacter pasteurianus subsp. pasteurianus]|uniref:Uncharacterized protein n=1 Tax=Acetobacter pasteurianus subsp. pasteurianus TaxID=481145 RepID=A0AAC9SS45_ACEPA|nr:hypothetical protein S101468_03340 [Acetobacter pasteurianus subsp. pasteurianus]
MSVWLRSLLGAGSVGVRSCDDARCTARAMEQLYVGGSAGAGQYAENQGLSDRGDTGRTAEALRDYD